MPLLPDGFWVIIPWSIYTLLWAGLTTKLIAEHKNGFTDKEKQQFKKSVAFYSMVLGIPFVGVALVLIGADMASKDSLKFDGGSLLFLLGIAILCCFVAFIKNTSNRK